tara:strand:- start:264 stop:401 length:138 start_codon:yes stop_codon:yes gene_type:complete
VIADLSIRLGGGLRKSDFEPEPREKACFENKNEKGKVAQKVNEWD